MLLEELDRAFYAILDGGDDLIRVMFVPSSNLSVPAVTMLVHRVGLPWVWIYLTEFFLVDCYRLACLVEDEEPRARRALVYTANEYLV